jgi:SH3 domain protein
MIKYKQIISLIIGLTLFYEFSFASTAYVTDSFEITLRTGPSNTNKIIQLLKSGDSVEIINEENGWSQVNITREEGNDKEGWVLTRYLEQKLPWKMQTKALSRENAGLKEKLRGTEKEGIDVRQQNRELKKQLKKTNSDLDKLQNEYDSLKQGSTSYLETKNELDETTSKLKKSNADIQRLTNEIENLQTSEAIKWFATGAIVIICGWFIGLAMGRQQKKRPHSLFK